MATKYTGKLRGKRILVLGGSSGIGFCVAEASVEHGAIVTISSSRQPKIDKAIERILSSYPDAKDRVNGITCDLGTAETMEDNIVALYKFATEDGKHKLDHIVNTAGDSLTIPSFDEIGIEHIQKATQVRWNGTILMGKHAKTYLNKSSSSSFTATGGVNSYKPQKNWLLQAGSGSGIEGIIRALAVELAPARANIVAPGAVLTELWSALSADMLEKIKKNYESQLLTGSIGKPEDTAEAYIYCMKDSFLTGQAILTDGGSLLKHELILKIRSDRNQKVVVGLQTNIGTGMSNKLLNMLGGSPTVKFGVNEDDQLAQWPC